MRFAWTTWREATRRVSQWRSGRESQPWLDDELAGASGSSLVTTFARNGNPNSTSTPRWAPFSDGDTTLRLALGSGAITPTQFAQDHRCGFWNHHS